MLYKYTYSFQQGLYMLSYHVVFGKPILAWRHSERVWRRKDWGVNHGANTQKCASKCSLLSRKEAVFS